MSSCQTCSSELTPALLKSSFLPPCCATPICSRCVTMNPRLRDYVPCLRCGDPRTSELRGSGRESRTIPNARPADQNDVDLGAGTHRVLGHGQVGSEAEVVFEIGDEDEDEDENEAGDECNQDLPPSYETIEPLTDHDSHNGGLVTSRGDEMAARGLSRQKSSSDIVDGTGRTPKQVESETGEMEGLEETEVVEVRHTLKRGDTLLAIARKYAADPHELLTLNNLPHSLLTTQPHLLRTRSSLLISRRTIARKSLSVAQPAPYADLDATTDIDERREKEKQVKRFQLVTKTLDPGVGRVYLGLAEMREGLHPLEEGSGEALVGTEPDVTEKMTNSESEKNNLGNRLYGKGDGNASGRQREGGKKVLRSDGENRQDRALEAFWGDEEWEEAVGGPSQAKQVGKWKVVGGAMAAVGIKI